MSRQDSTIYQVQRSLCRKPFGTHVGNEERTVTEHNSNHKNQIKPLVRRMSTYGSSAPRATGPRRYSQRIARILTYICARNFITYVVVAKPGGPRDNWAYRMRTAPIPIAKSDLCSQVCKSDLTPVPRSQCHGAKSGAVHIYGS